jgi:hypothetical protein
LIQNRALDSAGKMRDHIAWATNAPAARRRRRREWTASTNQVAVTGRIK